jgi:hypothetical protein
MELNGAINRISLEIGAKLRKTAFWVSSTRRLAPNGKLPHRRPYRHNGVASGVFINHHPHKGG